MAGVAEARSGSAGSSSATDRQVARRDVDRPAPGVLDPPALEPGEEADEVALDLGDDRRVELGAAAGAGPETIRPPPQPNAIRPSGVVRK